MALFGSRRIYLDYASATPVHPSAARALAQALTHMGNPSAIHAEGVEAQQMLDEARESLARTFGVKPRELIFTSGGTEGNNLAILGHARALLRMKESLAGTHWIVSAIEHPSVLSCFGEIERLGGTVTFVDSDAKGIVRADAIRSALRRETVFVSVGWANGETGVIQPIAEIARAIAVHERAHRSRVLLHTDAGQAPVYLSSTIHSLRADLVTLDSAKLYGPRGIGALYLSNRTDLSSILFGGSQERKLRPGTENVALAVGFAEAMTQIVKIRKAEAKRVGELRKEFLALLTESLPELVINGDLSHALPNMLNISLPEIQSEYITLSLDRAGIAISTKSACREGEERRSHVVESLGGETWRAENTLRFSLGQGSTKQDIRQAAQALDHLMHKDAPKKPPRRG